MSIYKLSIAIAAVVACSLTANAQTLTVGSTQNEITASEAGSYDRVEYVRQAEAGQMILASFPAKLDGYYFGPDAQRLKVTDVKDNAEGRMDITTEEMADGEDFLPGVQYLITPTQDLQSIVCLAPAKKTTVPATSTPLVFQNADEGSTTAIADIKVTSKMEDGVAYDLSGRRQTGTQRGFYVMKNRKVFVK